MTASFERRPSAGPAPIARADDVQGSAADGRWAAAVVRFNLDPVAYADPSWLPPWAPQAGPRVRQELSRALLRDHGLEAANDWELHSPAARLFMIDRCALGEIGLAVGIASHRDSLRRVVRKDQLTALRACLGEAASSMWLGVAETVPRAPAPLALQWDLFDAAALVRALTGIGQREMLRLLDAADPAQRAVATRARFCLPRGADAHDLPSAAAPLLPPLPPDRAARMAEAIVTDLIPRWAPSWTWLF